MRVMIICNPQMRAVDSKLTLVALIDHHLEAAVVVADHEGGRLRLRQAVLPVVPLQRDDLRQLGGVGQALDVQLRLEKKE